MKNVIKDIYNDENLDDVVDEFVNYTVNENLIQKNFGSNLMPEDNYVIMGANKNSFWRLINLSEDYFEDVNYISLFDYFCIQSPDKNLSINVDIKEDEDVGVGKTCLISRFISGNFDANVNSTNGASYASKKIEYANLGKTLVLDIWDTAGQEKYKSLTKFFYKDAAMVILVYDITRKESFDNLKNFWYTEIQQYGDKDIILGIAGNKSDLYDNEAVPEKEARDFAKSIGAIFALTSAQNNSGVNKLFEDIGNKFLDPNFQDKVQDNKIEREQAKSITLEKKQVIEQNKKIKKESKIEFLTVDELFDINNHEGKAEEIIDDELHSDDDIIFELKIKPLKKIGIHYYPKIKKQIPLINLSQIEYNKQKVINEADLYSLQKRKFKYQNIDENIKTMNKKVKKYKHICKLNKNKMMI